MGMQYTKYGNAIHTVWECNTQSMQYKVWECNTHSIGMKHGNAIYTVWERKGV